MKTLRSAKKGQFSIIAALLVSVILVTAVISTYTMVRNSPIRNSPKVLTAIGEMNIDIKKTLDFTVGYYGSILKVTGNSTYAQELTKNYLSSGLLNIARSHPEWNPSFELDSQKITTSWFMPDSSSIGNISVTYSLSALGIEGVKYETSSALKVTMLESVAGVARVSITRDFSEPEIGLTKENFYFYNYTDDSTWELINPTDIIIASNGVYNLTLPNGIDADFYSLQVEDHRGIMVSAFYSPASVKEERIPHFTYAFDWNSTGMIDIYEALSTDRFAIELLQNGTLKWLGQPLNVTSNVRPIPPLAIKAFHVNATINEVNQEVPFQVEDWASAYNVPLGLAGNNSLFNNNNMIVFMINDNVSNITLWWNGDDTVVQTSYAWRNIYFSDDPDYDSNFGRLDNGLLRVDVNNFYAISSLIGESETYKADFLRVNDVPAGYGAQPAYIIYNGVVRDIIEVEPEYGGGGVSGCPNFYSQVVLTLPANAPYYTYSVRTILVDWLQPRDVDDLSVIQISKLPGVTLTEDGTSGDYPEISNSTGLFFDMYPSDWAHHWSQNVGRKLVDAESFEGSWLPSGWTRTNRWNKEDDSYYHGSYSADCDGGGGLSYLTTPDLDTSDATNINVDFWYRDGGCESDEFVLQYFDGSSWDTVFDLGSTSSSSWQQYHVEITDSQYFKSDFKLRWVSNTTEYNHNSWVDLVTISKLVSEEENPGAGIMFTDADNEHLYIFDDSARKGALKVTGASIEFNPVDEGLNSMSLPDPLDITWHGAVVTFKEEPIYDSSDEGGLWVMVEHPPAVTVD